MTLKDLGFAERNTLLIPLDVRVWVRYGHTVRLDGTEFAAKDEVHVTVVNKELGQELEERVAGRPAVHTALRGAIRGAAWNRAECAYTRGGLYHAAKDKDRVDDQGNPILLHAESIVQRVGVPGIEDFYAALEAIVGRTLEIPPTHVTLYVLGDRRGISLADQRAFEAYVTREIAVDELIRVR